VKEFLSQRGIEYVEKDLALNEQALEELTELGHMSTPVTIVDGKVVVGFDRKKLEELLG
jgi:glutaredoxin